MTTSARYSKALHLIDDAHAQDPTRVTLANGDVGAPYELHYADKMSKYLAQREPNAPEPLRLAIRAQHLRRWEVPRSSYPMTKVGYHAWRTFLKKRQAELAHGYCREAGYGEEDADRVAMLVRKENLKSDSETQVLEDVACLVFLDDQFEEFEKEHDEDKIIRILQKTWAKMSDNGHRIALTIPLSERAKSLIQRALDGADK